MAKKTLGIDNNILMGAMILGGGYLLLNSGIIGQVQTAIQGALTPPSASVSGASTASGSTLNLTSAGATGAQGGFICPDGTQPNANNICSNGLPAIPSGQTQLLGQIGSPVIPTVSGGADIGGGGVDGPSFTDPTTGITSTPGAVGQLPNFNPFVLAPSPSVPFASSPSPTCPDGSFPDPTTGACANGQTVCPAGTRWSPCFQTCRPAGLAEPIAGSAQCVGGTGTTPCIQTQLCTTTSHWDSTQCACVPNAPTTTPAQNPCAWQYCGPNGQWDSNLCQCVPAAGPGGAQPVASPPPTTGTPTTTPTPTPTPVTTPTPTPTPVTTPTPTPTPTPVTTCPAGYSQVGTSCVQVIQNTPAPVQSNTGTLNCSKSGAGCCNSGHKGNCHSECGFGKSMNSSTCLSCLSVCGTYNGSCNCSTGTAAVGTVEAFPALAKFPYQSETQMIRGFARRHNQYSIFTNQQAKVTSQSTKYSPQSITNQVFGRKYGYHGRLTVS